MGAAALGREVPLEGGSWHSAVRSSWSSSSIAVVMVQYGCSPGSRFRLYVVTSMLGLASMLEVLPLTRRVSRSRSLKGGATVNTTLCRTHELKSGDRRRPETERQGLTPRPSHDSRVAFREFVTHDGTSSSIRLSGPPEVVACASSLRCELHSRLQSPQVAPSRVNGRRPSEN